MTRDTLLRVMQILFTTAVIELRAFGARVGTRTLPMSGYYDDAYALAHRAEALDQAGAESICVTLNELDPALLARSANVLRVAARGATTCDGEVRRRRYVLLDFDAMRPSGISATDGEHALALQRASDARAWLARFGIGSILADSGNGGHVVVPVDQPNDAAALAVITGFTKAVAFQFDDAHVKVDLTTVNAARVVKLYGTMARKGSDMPDRPHRRSALLDVPSLLTPVPANVLQDIASRLPSRPTAVAMSSNQPFDVAGWLAAHQLVVASQGEWNGHYKFVLETCPFEAAHTNRSAYVIHMSSGAIAAGCHHASCADKTWRDVRALYDTRPAVPVTPLPPSRQWPAPLEAAAFTGLAGDIVRLIEPATEADSAALLVQLLAAFGNVIGHAAHWEIEATPHYLNLFVVLVGFTSAGRKGTALQRVKRMLTAIDPAWAESRITPGLSSGEGLIWAVRNPLGEDLGVHDKRLMVIEPELAGALKVLQREGNTLSSMLRSAWDDGLLASLPKKQPARATGAHISVIGHIGKPELTRLLREVEMANGFANRFLFVCSRRSKTLPGGGVVDPDAQAKLENRLKDAVTFGKTAGLLTRDRDAESLWAQHYPALTADRAGLLGGITARGAAQVMRLAAIYALLDETTTITVTHLNAALAIWRYSVASVEYVFGDGLGDPVADAILAALRAEPAGLTRTDIRDLFNRHEKLGRVDAALESLQEAGLAERVEEPTAGRPVERWFAVTAAARV